MIREYKVKIDWALIFIILVPLFYITNMNLRSGQTWIFQVLAFFLLGLFHINRYIGYLILWILFQYVVLKKGDIGNPQFINLFFGAMIYHMVTILCKQKDYKRYFIAFVSILALSVFWGVRQMYQLDPIFSMREIQHQSVFSEYAGFFGIPALLGNFAAFVTPMMFALSYTLIPLSLIALFFSKSTFSVLAAVCSVLFYVFFRNRLLFWTSLAILGSAFAFYAIKYDYPTGQFERRLRVWELVEKVSFKNPLGYGLGHYSKNHLIEFSPSGHLVWVDTDKKVRQYYANEAKLLEKPELVPMILTEPDIQKVQSSTQKEGFDIQKWNEVHNEYIQAFFEIGLPGLMIIFAYIFNMFDRFYRYGRHYKDTLILMACFIAVLIVSIGHFPFHVARLAAPAIMIMALLDNALLKRKKELSLVI